jgi:hypothetical protein
MIELATDHLLFNLEEALPLLGRSPPARSNGRCRWLDSSHSPCLFHKYLDSDVVFGVKDSLVVARRTR